MTRYASATSISADRSRAEIEKLLRQHGATGFAYGWQDDQAEKSRARIEFMMQHRHLRFELALPSVSDFNMTPGGRRHRSPQDQERVWEQACRSSWRALLLIIKAKLEAIAIGVSVFEQEFLAFIVTRDGRTVADIVVPQLTSQGSSRLLLVAKEDR